MEMALSGYQTSTGNQGKGDPGFATRPHGRLSAPWSPVYPGSPLRAPVHRFAGTLADRAEPRLSGPGILSEKNSAACQLFRAVFLCCLFEGKYLGKREAGVFQECL